MTFVQDEGYQSQTKKVVYFDFHEKKCFKISITLLIWLYTGGQRDLHCSADLNLTIIISGIAFLPGLLLTKQFR